jgi:hypothetical protein
MGFHEMCPSWPKELCCLWRHIAFSLIMMCEINSAFEIIITIIIYGTELGAKHVYMCHHLWNYSVSQKPILSLPIH